MKKRIELVLTKTFYESVLRVLNTEEDNIHLDDLVVALKQAWAAGQVVEEEKS